jgi:biopolymer transport protein ExbD
MARTFRRHRQSHPIAELNVTNLIDLGFTLLIIFMITTSSTVSEQTIPLNLPAESKSAQQKPDKDTKFMSVSIDAKGSYYLNDKPISFGDLSVQLKAFSAQTKPPVIRIRGDGNVPFQKVVSLMDELKKNKLSAITIDTRPGE